MSCCCMPLFRYYFSTSPGDRSPATEELHSVEADSTVDAIARLKQAGQVPCNGQGAWIHFLVWMDPAGGNRGFESISLGK